MSAGYADVDIRPCGDLCLAARFRLENRGGETWRAGEGFRVGYQFVDPEEGWLSCRTVGVGRMAAPEKILEAIERLLAHRTA